MASPHIVVVGGGVIGVSTAYYLAKQGQRVTLIEQNDLCSGSSHGNAGQLTPEHPPVNQPGMILRNLLWLFKPKSPLYIPLRFDPKLLAWLWRFQRACRPHRVHHAMEVLGQLGKASMELFDQFASEFDFGYQDQGRLEICRTQKGFHALQKEAQSLQEMEFPSRILTATEVVELEPAITGQVAGAVHFLSARHCNPRTFVIRLAEAAVELGLEISAPEQVTDIHIESNHVRVATSNDELQADSVVLACGAWACRLARRLGLRLPIQPGKGYHLDIDPPARCPKIPLAMFEERMVVTPIDDFLRLAGTMELSGFNLRQHPTRLEMLAEGAARYLSDVTGAKERSRWCHLRPMSADGLPLVGPVPGKHNIWIATGHGMLGLTQGPITGKLVAEGILQQKPSMDLALLRPDRF